MNKRDPDPHLGLRFWIEIGGIEIAGFSECTGLSVEWEMMEYSEGGLNTNTHKLPTRLKFSNITLKRGVNPGRELYDWFAKTLDGQPKKRTNISISIYGPKPNDLVRKFDLIDAIPVKWTGPDMRTDAGATYIESIEFAHHGIIDSFRRQ